MKIADFIQRKNWAILILFVGVALLLHSQNYGKGFLLDEGYGLLSNSYVRSFKYIPQYFADPGTLTSLRENAEYRPILQVTYALNYWISGYSMWSWHLLQIILHSCVAFFLYLFCLQVFKSPWGKREITSSGITAFWVSAVFLIHPYTAGVVNYLWARSSLLVSFFLLPSLFYLMKAMEVTTQSASPRLRFLILSWLFFGLALFTKVEAVGGLAVLLILVGLSSWKTGDSVRTCARRSFSVANLKLVSPYLAWTFAYVLVRNAVVSDYLVEARKFSDMTSLTYLYTQFTAWWHYVLRWIAPVGLIADDLTYPIFKHFYDPQVLLALTGWLAVGASAIVRFPVSPLFWMTSLSALVLISPTSSIAPLAEMVNEHRPYLPLAILSMGFIPFVVRFFGEQNYRRFLVLFVPLLITTLALLTWDRNRVYSSNENFWADVVKKAPSSRSLMNYGLIFLQKADHLKALDYFSRALAEAPNWHMLHINLGLAYEGLGQSGEASKHFDQAVLMDHYSSMALVFRGSFLNRIRHYEKARKDLTASLALAREKYEIYKELAKASAGLGDGAAALSYTVLCLKTEPSRVEFDIVDVSNPFWESPARYDAGIRYYQELVNVFGSRTWLDANIQRLTALNQAANRNGSPAPRIR